MSFNASSWDATVEPAEVVRRRLRRERTVRAIVTAVALGAVALVIHLGGPAALAGSAGWTAAVVVAAVLAMVALLVCWVSPGGDHRP